MFFSCFGACRTAPSCPIDARTDAGQVFADHLVERSDWRSLKAEARVTQSGGRGRVRGTVLMLLRTPNEVRFDVMTPLGPAAVLTSHGDGFQLSDLRGGVFIHGPSCPENLARLLGVAIEPEDVLRLLTGQAPNFEAAEQSVQCREGVYVVRRVVEDGAVQELGFAVTGRKESPILELRRAAEWSADGAPRWEAIYDDYEWFAGRYFPSEVRFIDQAHNAETSVRFKSISVDPDIPDGAFVQTPGPGMSVELATCR